MMLLCVMFTFFFLLFPRDTESFNVDVQHPVVITGPTNSYFGYTVALHNNTDGNWILVGAPKANSTYLSQEYGIFEPGVLFKCKVEDDVQVEINCSEIIVDKTGNSLSPDIELDKESAYKDFKDGSWLGVSLDVKPQTQSEIVVCAHLWKNQRYISHYLPNGVCYTIPSTLDTKPILKLTPLVSHRRQIIHPGVYYFALGQVGFASHYTEEGNMVLGAPGVFDWTGNIVYYNKSEVDDKISKPIITLPILEKPDVIYFGYSLSSGRFFSDQNEDSLVVGAPRDQNTGTVYVISQPQGTRREEVLIKIRKEGSQMGEYFGACVCAIDLNDDGLSDLIVGAPQHALRVNEGRIYVYINQNSGLLKPVKESIMGDARANSHFGTAVGAIGDINQDGYRDVAVGAPYEGDGGEGAVYIYHGTSTGIKAKYVQKILPQPINPQIKGFGISFSRGKDMDENLYPDFAVGAFDSSQTIFFKTQPVIQLSATVNFEPNQIAPNVSKCHSSNRTLWTCFSIETCLHFSGKWTPFKIDIQLTIQTDSLKPNDSRTFFEFENKTTSTLSSAITLYETHPTCDIHQVYLQNDIRDFLTPINFYLIYNLSRSSSLSKSFCKTCPVLDPSTPNTCNKQILFTKNCGDDDTCEADLKVVATIRNYEFPQPFVIGSSNYLYLDLTVSNEGEPAYESTVQISAPSWVHFQRLPHTCVVQDDEFVVTCFLGNPFKAQEQSKLSVNVNVENMPSKAKELLFNITAHTASIEIEENLMDNSIQLVLPLKKVADIAIFGISSQEQISSNSRATDAKLFFSHKYEVTKFEPSPIDSVTMEISVPITTIKHKDLPLTLFNIRSIKFHESSSGNAIFGSCQGIEKDLLTTTNDASPHLNKPRQTRSVNNQNVTSINHAYNNLYVLNCSNAKCIEIRCSLGDFIRNETLSFELDIEAHVDNIHKFMSQSDSTIDTLQYITSGQVFINNEASDIQPQNHRPDFAKVSTFFISRTPNPKEASLWIIIVSSLAGCLLFFVLTMALIKLGFFRRQTREDMKNLMHAPQLIKDENDSFALDNLMFDTTDY